MKRFALAFLVAALALCGSQHTAKAATQVMCSPASGGQQGRTATLPGASATYALNALGCAPIALGDVPIFQAAGFAPGPVGTNQGLVTGVATGTTSFLVATLPPNAIIREIIVSNVTANAVTGGIAFGTTSGGNDVVTALTCGANCLTFTADSALLKRIFSTTASQQIFATAVTAWNSANVTITVSYRYF